MTQQELEAGIAALQSRVRLKEDIEEIRKLMASYEEYLDSLQRFDELMALFTEDAKSVAYFPNKAGVEESSWEHTRERRVSEAF